MNDSASYNLQLPAPAESHFNDEAVNILGTLVPIEAPSSPGSGVESSASLRPTITVDYSQVQNARFALVKHDLLGNLKAFAFETTTGHVGLREEAFDRFEQLLTRFSERPEVRDALSRRFLESSLRAWLEMRNKDDLPESQDFVAYIRSQASHEVMNRRVDIPIDHLAIEAPFKLGNVVLRFHTREFWEELEAKTRARHPEATASSALAILRRDFQGFSNRLDRSLRGSVEVHRSRKNRDRKGPDSTSVLLTCRLLVAADRLLWNERKDAAS